MSTEAAPSVTLAEGSRLCSSKNSIKRLV